MAWRSGPPRLTAYIGLTVLQAVIPVAVAWLTKLLIDGLVGGWSGTALIWLGGGLAVVGTVLILAGQAGQYLRVELDRAVALHASDRLYLAVDRFTGLSRFEDPVFLDRLRLAQQSGGLAPMRAVDAVVGVGSAAVTVIGFLVSLVALSPLTAVAVILAGIPVVLAELALSRLRVTTLWQITPAERREIFYAGLLGSVEAAKEVRLFGIGPYLRGRMLTERRTADAGRRAVDRRELSLQGRLGGLSTVVAGAGLVWQVVAAHNGTISVGDVSMFVAAVAGTQGALAALAMNVARSRESLLLFEHVMDVLDAPADLPVPATAAAVPALRRGIELRDVWFRYSDDHPWSLRGVSLTIPAGASVALVGLNGAGKSTLVKLLCRFYDPTVGEIRWDGSDLRGLDPATLRARIGGVFQDYMCYDLTAAENVALGDLSALTDQARIETAARRAGIHDRITELPDGYRTMLSRAFFAGDSTDGGDGSGPPSAGVVLSEGQWQRLAVARALVRPAPDLMVLDEPSAGLDAEAEYQLHRSLREQRHGRTTLLISHRLGALRDADLIVVLDDGQVAEQGSHLDLMARDGRYSRLFRRQAAGYTMETVPG